MTSAMTIDDLHAFMAEAFVQVAGDFVVEELEPTRLRLRMKVGTDNLRPGGTVSGPSMFSLADVAVYLMTLSRIGPQALAVTTNCSIDFMRKPAPRDLIAECRLLKLGRALSVGDVMIYSEGQPDPVARATLTYSIPPAA